MKIIGSNHLEDPLNCRQRFGGLISANLANQFCFIKIWLFAYKIVKCERMCTRACSNKCDGICEEKKTVWFTWNVCQCILKIEFHQWLYPNFCWERDPVGSERSDWKTKKNSIFPEFSMKHHNWNPTFKIIIHYFSPSLWYARVGCSGNKFSFESNKNKINRQTTAPLPLHIHAYTFILVY